MIPNIPAVAWILFLGLIPSAALAQSENVGSELEKYQTLLPGIHGTSNLPDIKITGVTISSDREISIDLRYTGTAATSPPVVIVANALTNRTEQSPIEGSQILNEGWVSPASLTITVNGSSSLYDANLVSIVASPYGSPPPSPLR
jgi:hypothetical protein